ncbi:hypothetical protein ACH4MG_34945 [Streptomyces sp. NPDC017454]|uniref:hypothetical protein n=1 Tax=Streptomyces sp. NPDC017454 TaxID=3364997 RepID=UPI0037A8B0A6
MLAEMALAQSKQLQATCVWGRTWSQPFAQEPTPEEMAAMEDELFERFKRNGWRTKSKSRVTFEIVPASWVAIEYASRGYIGSPSLTP